MDRYAVQIAAVIFCGFLLLFAFNGGQKNLHRQKEQAAIGFVRQ